jgi:phosphate transport system permease protein
MSSARRQGTVTVSSVFSFTAALFVVAIVISLFLILFWQSIPAWRHEGLGFLLGTDWFYRDRRFGTASMIYGTSVVAAVALSIAAPIGIGTAIFTAEYMRARGRIALKIVVELLSAIPSVVYGLLGILYLRNWVYRALTPLDPLSGDTLMTAGILLATMILPTIMTLADDALRGVPHTQRLAARGLGLNTGETVLSVTLPFALPGILSAVLLALGRALGETVAVFLVVGRQDNQWPSALMSVRPLMEAGQTLTSKLGGSETNIAYGDTLHWAAIVGLGLILLTLTVAVTLLGIWLREGRRSACVG